LGKILDLRELRDPELIELLFEPADISDLSFHLGAI